MNQYATRISTLLEYSNIYLDITLRNAMRYNKVDKEYIPNSFKSHNNLYGIDTLSRYKFTDLRNGNLRKFSVKRDIKYSALNL